MTTPTRKAARDMGATQQTNERLAALTAAGVSVWLDQVRRSLVETGELRRLVEEDSLRGVTSNPAIFEKAILGSPEYDEQLAELARDGADNRRIYREVAVRDIQEAADVLRPVYDATGGADAGVPAIEQMIYEGRNINVTLLFAVDAYQRIAEAYIRGLERRLDEGKSVDGIHSVASFFVSRVDTEVDKRLEALGRTDLEGRAGLANARAAYQRYKQLFHGERFARLRDAGAHVQRPLWASTGVKNPKYPDTMYVDELIAPETVNTMPMASLLAAGHHANVDGPTADQDPTPDLQALAEAGVDLDDVTDLLLREGIEKFVEPMEKLLDGIESKREAIVTSRPPTIESSIPDDLEPAVAARIERAAGEDVARRIWRKDDTLWGEHGAPEIANRLGWLTITEQMEEEAAELRAFARDIADEGTTDVVLLGMGGSSLAPEVIRQSYGPQEGFPLLHVLDSTDAGAIRAVEHAIDVERTLFLVSTKSGGTIETLSLFEHFWALVPDGSRFVAITDPGSSLEALARDRGFRRTFLNDPDIGGGPSAPSPLWAVPAALMGVDVQELIDSAEVAEQVSVAFDSSRNNSGLWLGVTLGELAVQGRDKLTFVVSDPLRSFGLWVEQLVAESTGKDGKGMLPVAGEPLGEPDVYGHDRTFVHLRNPERADDEIDARMRALAQAGHPVITLTVGDAADLGRIFFFAEFATAVAGWVLGINPFDQPNVQEAKDNTAKVLAMAEPPDLPAADDGALRALLERAEPPHYVAIMGYVPPSEEFDAAAVELRQAIRDATKATTTFGYGPRFLHSTGQLHKGGPPTGLFLQLVHDPPGDADVPGADYSFATLIRAQADGDLLTLRDHDLPAERVKLEGDPAQALRALTERVRGLL